MIVGEEETTINKLYIVLYYNQLGTIKECKTIIRHKNIYVNNVIIDNPDYLVSFNDRIVYNHQEINNHPFVYYMLYKPKDYICANSDKQHSCVIDLIDRDDCYCVGRLDKDTTGLLLMTNDKSLSKATLLPDRHVDKTYEVVVDKELNQSLVQQFEKGIIIDKNVKCLPAKLEILSTFKAQITICEGKYHQIKKMFLSCGYQVLQLKRLTFGKIQLDDNLKEGQYRLLNDEEILLLKGE